LRHKTTSRGGEREVTEASGKRREKKVRGKNCMNRTLGVEPTRAKKEGLGVLKI